MDEHGIDWVCGCHLVRFWLESWGTRAADSCHTLSTIIRPSITHMGQMTTPKPLIYIISWTCQEMMVWMSMELMGSVDVILTDFGLKVGQLAQLILVIP
jgi:hypothetical protein